MLVTGFDQAKSAYQDQYPCLPFFETWIPESQFISALIDELGNISISREDDGIYGIALGASPEIPTTWKNFSIESQGLAALPEDCKVVTEWDSYWAETTSGKFNPGARSEDAVIAKFLKEHAPESSVFPGDEEIQQWIEIHENGELVAIAALCRWQSGRVVISSVATHLDYRGRGLGKALMKDCLVASAELGEKFVSLGVRHRNESAQRLYAATGFRLMHNFTYCERR